MAVRRAPDGLPAPGPAPAAGLEAVTQAWRGTLIAWGDRGGEGQMTMQNGIEIVRDAARGRDWWRLGAADLAPLLAAAPRFERSLLTGRGQWPGRQWNGVSDVAVGSATATADDLAKLLSEIGEGMAAALGQHATAPGASDIRLHSGWNRGRDNAVVDLDLGEMLLPVQIDQAALRDATDRRGSLAGAVSRFVEAVAPRLPSLIARERRLRQALERATARMGYGAAPVWLRMAPACLDWPPEALRRPAYSALTLHLDGRLEWAPLILGRISTVRDVAAVQAGECRGHRRRARLLAELASSGSRGWISDVATALISSCNGEPAAAYDHLASRQRTGTLATEFLENDKGNRIEFSLREGTLNARFAFPGGGYEAGVLILSGRWPESIAAAAVGRRLGDLVDHPALLASRSRVARAEITGSGLELHHRVRAIPVGAAIPQAIRTRLDMAA